jgi:general secretion pathway protein D
MKKIPSTIRISNIHLACFSSVNAIMFIAARSMLYSAPIVLGLNFAATAQTPPAAAGAAAGASRSPQGVTLNFVNAEIAEVARTMGVMTNRNIVVDPRVKGTMNLSSDKPLSTAAAYNQFLAMLRFQGFTVVEAGGISKIVPEADAKLQGGSVTTSEARVGGNQISTQIFRLNYETANNLVPILRPLISPNNTINVNPGNNSLIITDYADNLQRLSRIIATLDVANATDLEIITLQHAVAADLAPLLLRLSEGGSIPGAAAGQADTAFKTTILPEPRSNAIIIRAANPARLQIIKSLVQKLDQPSSALNSGNIHVVYLKNADATRVAATLRAALAANTSGAASAGGGGTVAAAPQPAAGAAGASAATAPTSQNALPSTGGNIQADPATNSLIITASEPQFRQIRAVIDMLDTRRAQVYVESLIAEVNSDKAAEFGIQWQNVLGNKGDKNIGVLGTNFGAGGNNIIGLGVGASTGTVLPGKGFNFGLVRDLGGTYVLGLLANFLQTSGDGNVLSTPNLLTLDNEEAKIVIGQNVPFVTGQFTNTGAGGTGGSVNPFQTIERKDVGLTLRVKPQISENGTIKMQIFQEVSNVDPASVGSASGLITNKRSIESSVLVEDGGIVVIGGLLQDEFNNSQERVPGLSDIPIFGNLFKSESRKRKKTNLMVFLRPVVVRSAQDSESLSLDRYDIMRVLQKDSQPNPSSVLKINDSPVLPPQRPVTQPSGTQKPVLPPLGAPVEKGGP